VAILNKDSVVPNRYQSLELGISISIIMSNTSVQPVKYNRLGSSGLRVSVPIVSTQTCHRTGMFLVVRLMKLIFLLQLGCMSLGSSKWIVSSDTCISMEQTLIMQQSWVVDEEPSLEVLKAAYDRGVTTFDTANVYSNGESERVIGKFIQKVCIDEHSQFLSCK
jgi:hypothetical protein